jgi:hypothetical protein
MPSGGRATQFGDKCKDCGVELTLENGILNGHNVKVRCRKCENLRASQRPSRVNGARKDQYLQWKYGITLEQYKEMLVAQDNKCAICKQECITGRELAVDHDHKTGEIRALLCIRCNSVLGQINDNISLLHEISNYLIKHLATGIN